MRGLDYEGFGNVRGLDYKGFGKCEGSRQVFEGVLKSKAKLTLP